MAWTAPSRRTTGEMVTAAVWNATLVNDALYLKGYEVPAGIIAVFDAACPTGWTRVAAWDGQFVRGAASYGGSGGTSLHGHTTPVHAHTTPDHYHHITIGALNYTYGVFVVFTSAADKNLLASAGAGSARGAVGLISDGAGTSGNNVPGNWGDGSTVPEYVDVVFCKKN